MLLNRLDVTNRQGTVLELPLEDNSNGFSVKGIEGLDPVKATLVSSSFSNADGEQYHSSRREARDIKLSLGLDPDYGTISVKDLRDALSNYFMPKSKVTLGFHMFDKFAVSIFLGSLDLIIDGYVESFEAPLFVKDPTVDLIVRCFDPDFINPIPVIFDGSTVANLTETVLSYPGTVETGLIFTLMPDRAIDAFTIFHRPPDETLRMFDFSYPLLAGDVLKISTMVGSKSIKNTRVGVESSLLYAMSPQSNWLELQPGDNNLRVYAEGAPIPFSIEYTTRYGGL